MKAPVGNNSDFQIAPSGAHPAILTQLIDLGTQEGEYQGKTTHLRKIRMVFELHSDEAKTDDGKPMVAGRNFTLSNYESAALRGFIEGWRGRAFTEQEAIDFDYKVMLGQPCILNITHKRSHDGTKTYANIDSAMRLMNGMAAPAQVNPSLYFYMGTDESGFAEYEPEVLHQLPEWLKGIIWKSPEYLKASGQMDAQPQAARQASPAPADAPFDDDIPF